MGNRISIAQEERNEAEFESLVDAVVYAQQSAGVYDLEAGRVPNTIEDPIDDRNRRYYTPRTRDSPYSTPDGKIRPSVLVVSSAQLT